MCCAAWRACWGGWVAGAGLPRCRGRAGRAARTPPYPGPELVSSPLVACLSVLCVTLAGSDNCILLCRYHRRRATSPGCSQD